MGGILARQQWTRVKRVACAGNHGRFVGGWPRRVISYPSRGWPVPALPCGRTSASSACESWHFWDFLCSRDGWSASSRRGAARAGASEGIARSAGTTCVRRPSDVRNVGRRRSGVRREPGARRCAPPVFEIRRVELRAAVRASRGFGWGFGFVLLKALALVAAERPDVHRGRRGGIGRALGGARPAVSGDERIFCAGGEDTLKRELRTCARWGEGRNREATAGVLACAGVWIRRG
jgi:hypothetical protein